MTVPTPALLVARAQSGDRAALNALLTRIQQPLFDHVCAIVGDGDDALDVLQDTLMILARNLGALRDPRWFRAWAYRIATRQALRASGRARVWDEAVRGEALESLALPEADSSVDPEDLQAIPALLAALPPASGLVLRMHHIDGLSYLEIAEALEISIGTVKSRIAYGRDALRQRLATAPSRLSVRADG